MTHLLADLRLHVIDAGFESPVDEDGVPATTLEDFFDCTDCMGKLVFATDEATIAKVKSTAS